MRQVLYTSDSLIGDDPAELDRLMVQALRNNALDGLTGLLWTDGRRFAQVLEGGGDAMTDLLEKIRIDHRHRDFQMVSDRPIATREFGDWSMTRPVSDPLAEVYEQRMVQQLSWIGDALSRTFRSIIAGSRPGPQLA